MPNHPLQDSDPLLLNYQPLFDDKTLLKIQHLRELSQLHGFQFHFGNPPRLSADGSMWMVIVYIEGQKCAEAYGLTLASAMNNSAEKAINYFGMFGARKSSES